MANDNGRNLWIVLRDVIQYALIPLIVIMWSMVNKSVEDNAMTLKRVESNQIRVMSELISIRGDLSEHEEKQLRDSIERGRFHHTSRTSCVECKVPGRDMYPLPQKKPNTFNGK